MATIYFKLTFFIAFVFLILNVAARALGSTQPPNPALRGFTEGCEGKPQPCWYGIVPGVTRLFQVKQWAIDNGFHEIESWVRYEMGEWASDPVGTCREYNTQPPSSICFAPPNYITDRIIISTNTVNLSDVISILGLPSKIGLAEYDAQSVSFGATIEAHILTLDWWGFSNLSPHLPVEDWIIYSKSRILFGFHWHGFEPRSRYCQIELVEAICT